LRPSHEIEQTTSPEPPRAETPPDLGEIKRDIVDQIKQHLDSCNINKIIVIIMGILIYDLLI
jgi:hypothetical protein